MIKLLSGSMKKLQPNSQPAYDISKHAHNILRSAVDWAVFVLLHRCGELGFKIYLSFNPKKSYYYRSGL